MLWVVMFVAVVILVRFGFDGLKIAGVVAAMTLAVFGVRAFLNTFWKPRVEKSNQERKGYWEGASSSPNRPRNGFPLSSNGRRTLFSAATESPSADRPRARRTSLYSSEPY